MQPRTGGLSMENLLKIVASFLGWTLIALGVWSAAAVVAAGLAYFFWPSASSQVLRWAAVGECFWIFVLLARAMREAASFLD